MATPKKVTVEMDTKMPKKRVVRFETSDEDAAISNVYVSNAAVKALGNPDGIKITIEAA
jgi:invasion protein IalB